MKYLVIFNPISGRGSAKKQLSLIWALLTKHSLDFNLVHTKKPWEAADIAAQAARDGYDVVVAAGGDGTVNEVLNGIMRAKSEGFDKTALGVISIGTGNDFAYSMGIPIEVEAACQSLKEAQRRVIDVGIVHGSEIPAEGRYFGNAVGIGFDAAGTILANKLTRVHGFLAYLISAMGTIFFYYKAPTLEIQLDDEKQTLPSLLVSIMNGQRIGGGFKTAPDAKPDDGIFDLCIAHEVSRPRMFTLIPRFLNGSQASQPEISMAHSHSVTVNALQGSIPAHADGEIICTKGKSLKIEILPKQLEIIVGTA